MRRLVKLSAGRFSKCRAIFGILGKGFPSFPRRNAVPPDVGLTGVTYRRPRASALSPPRAPPSGMDTLSTRGPRDTKLTILVPASMIDDLRALRASSFQSTGDLVNRLLEAELEARASEVAEGREVLAKESQRRAEAVARRAPDMMPMPASSRASPPGSPPQASEADPRELLSFEDVALWASEGSQAEEPRRIADGREFVVWLRAEGRRGTLKDADEWGDLYRSRHPSQSEGTLSKHVGRVRNLARWWAKRSRGRVISAGVPEYRRISARIPC